MNVLILTIGSRGDIQPFIALGKGLQVAGHRATICTAEGFRPWVEEHGLGYAPMNNGMLDLMQTQEGRAAVEGGGNKLALLKQVQPILRRTLADEWEAAQAVRPDVLVYHPKALGGSAIAEKLGIPEFLALPLPMLTPTRAFPSPLFANLRLDGWANRFSYRLMDLFMLPYAGVIDTFRAKTLGLRRRGRFASQLTRADGQPIPVLYAYSRHILPVPDDFPPHVHVTGAWFLEGGDWQPSPDLARFLADGPPPVYIGFGSMSGVDPVRRARTVLDALAQAGQRGLLASGWGGLEASELPPEVHRIEAAPHDRLFPHMAVVVHHGGAGTTVAGLRAGKPSVICPFFGDQPFWGRVVYDLGVGPRPIPQKQLTAPRLAEAIAAAVADPEMQRRAAALGQQIRAEDGVARAVAVIEQVAAREKSLP